MDGLTSSQHLDKLGDAPGTSIWFLGVSDPIEDRVAIRACEPRKHRTCARIGAQGGDEILRHLNAGLPSVRGLPSTVLFRLPHLVVTGAMHSAAGDQSFSDRSVPLRPRASSLSRRETSPERRGVTAPQLTIDPAEADRLLERLVVRDG